MTRRAATQAANIPRESASGRRGVLQISNHSTAELIYIMYIIYVSGRSTCWEKKKAYHWCYSTKQGPTV